MHMALIKDQKSAVEMAWGPRYKISSIRKYNVGKKIDAKKKEGGRERGREEDEGYRAERFPKKEFDTMLLSMSPSG